MRRVLVLLVFVASLGAGESTLSARRCTCGGSSLTCGSIAEAHAIFEATVASTEVIRSSSGVWSTADPLVVALKDVRPLRGRAATVVSTPSGGSSCGFDFKTGERYLIFAHAGPSGGLSVSRCSHTRPLSKARGLVAYLQSPLPSSAPPPSRVWGTVERMARWINYEAEFVGVGGAQVTFTGRITHSVTTRSDGSYDIGTLPPGRYDITVQPPTSVPELAETRYWAETEIGVDKASACLEIGFNLPIRSSISGTVVDAQGNTVEKAFVQLHFPDQPDRLSRGNAGAGYTTGPDGRYVFEGLPPGRYVIGLNLEQRPASLLFPFHNDQARDAAGQTVISLKFGEQLVLQPLVARRR